MNERDLILRDAVTDRLDAQRNGLSRAMQVQGGGQFVPATSPFDSFISSRRIGYEHIEDRVEAYANDLLERVAAIRATQEARDLLDRMQIDPAQFTNGDLVELANLIAEVHGLRRTSAGRAASDAERRMNEHETTHCVHAKLLGEDCEACLNTTHYHHLRLAVVSVYDDAGRAPTGAAE